MGFSTNIITDYMPRTYNLPFAAAPDEQAVRRVFQRQYHRPQNESWADTSCRIAAMNKNDIHNQLREGVITPNQAQRRLRCTPPNARLHKHVRRSCHHHGCPWCRYRTMLSTFRGLYHNVVVPEREARRLKGRARTGARNRLVFGQVRITTPKEVSIESTIRSIVDEQLVRKIQRAGGICDGMTTTCVNDLRSETVIIVSVLGMSEKAVQHIEPRVKSVLKPAAAMRTIVEARHTMADSKATIEDVPDINIETTWMASVRGYDCPVFGPYQLLRLLKLTMPKTKDATGIRLKRFQPLGTWRSFLKSKMAMPKPIIYRRFRPHVVEVELKRDECEKTDEVVFVQSQLTKIGGLCHSGANIPEALSSPEEDFSASFRYAFAVRSHLPDIASRFRDPALCELRLNKDRLDAMKELLPAEFVQEVHKSMGKWRDDPEVRQIRRYWRDRWYKSERAVDRRNDQLVRATLRGVMRLCGRKLGLDSDLANMAIGRTVNEQRKSWTNTSNPHGYFDLNDEVLPRMLFPRTLTPFWIADCIGEPLAAVDGYLPPPEIGGVLWGQITDELSAYNNPHVTFVLRPPGCTRDVAVIHQDSNAKVFGKATRIGDSRYFIQPLKNYLEHCWNIWEGRPTDKVDLFKT